MSILKRHKNLIIKLTVTIFIVLIFLLYVFVESFKVSINIVLISMIIAYILNPIKRKIQSRKSIKDSSAALIIILSIMLFVVVCFIIFIPSLLRELNNLMPTLESIEDDFQEKIFKMNFMNSSFARYLFYEVQNKVQSIINGLPESLIEYLLFLGENIVSLAVIPIIIYYFLAYSNKVTNVFYSFVSLEKRSIVKKIVIDIDKMLGRYIESQLILSLIISVFTFVFLAIFKVKFSFILSLFNGMANIIPYFGPIVGGVPIVAVAILDSPRKVIWVLAYLIILQQVEGNILSPKITADNIDMNPLVIIILLLFGEKVGGFIGMILVIPIAVVIKVIYEDIKYYLF